MSSRQHGPLRGGPLPPLLVFLALVGAGMAFGVFHNRRVAQGKPDPVLAGVATLLHPFQRAGSHVRGGVTLSWDWVFGGRRLSAENARLRAELSRLQTENESLRARAAEAERLRAVLRFVEEEKAAPLLAPVTGWLPIARAETVTLGRGARDGVAPRAIVRTPSGLVGQVTDVSPVSAQVLLITDVGSRVGGMVIRGGKSLGYVGIVQGAGRGQPLQMVYLKRENDIRPGDVVVSSGHGGVFPRDIPVGTVVSVSEDKARFTKSAALTPLAASTADLREVLVLR